MPRAAEFVGPGKPFQIRDYDRPKVESGAILVRVRMATVCGTDLHIWHGRRKPPLPIILGHEALGTVEELGPGVATDSAGSPLSSGDRVTWSYIWSCGKCYHCSILKEPAGCTNRQVYGLFIPSDKPPHFGGAFGEYIYLKPGSAVFKLPEGLPDELVSPINCALVTVIQGLERVQLRLNEKVVIQGAGPLGLYAVALSKERGASMIISLDLVDSRLKLAEAFGADHTINVSQVEPESLVNQILSLTGGLGADLGVEVTGVPEAVPLGLRFLRDGGRYLTVGPIFAGAMAEIDLFTIIFRRLSMVGSARNEPSHILEALRFLERTRDRYPYKEIVALRYPLAQIEQAFEAADRRLAMRVGVVP